MKPQILFRKVHHWAAIVVALPLAVMIGAGVLLMLKKDLDWVQPPTVTGASTAFPAVPLDALFAAARGADRAGIDRWQDLDRVDFKPDKGVVKFVSASRWEVQVDTATGQVLQVAYRRSDLIESIHDGSFFADWTKLYLFLPSAVVLFMMWLTGLYLFFLPYLKRRQRRRSRAPAGAATVPPGQP